jgi:HlyD family secretion protein
VDIRILRTAGERWDKAGQVHAEQRYIWMIKKKIPLIALVILVAFGIAAGVYFYFQRTGRPKNILYLYGNVDIRQVQLAFHDTGRVQNLHVQEGDLVNPGQLVAELDPVRYEAAAAKARAEVASQKQVLARLLAGSRPEEIAEAEARVRGAKATLKDAQYTFVRNETLFAKGFVARQDLDNAERAYKAAKADLDAYRQALTLAVKGPRKEDIANARAQLRADEATLNLALRELADTRLFAPSTAVVQDRILEPGDIATPQTPVYTLALANPIWVRAYVEEPDLGKIVPGMKAGVTTDSFPGKVYNGWIGFISPTAEFTPKQVETTEYRSRLVYRVRVYVCNSDNELRLGMPATVTIRLDQPRPAKGAGSERPCQDD